ncbi:MAG TPA: hypothetical protein VGB59_07355 [Allosphingosinicella sp.]|jgi:hypothetical protein
MHVLSLFLILAAGQSAPAQSEHRCPTASSGGTQAPAGMAITEEGGPIQHSDRPKPKGMAVTAPAGGASSTAGSQAERHAINTKGTGTSGRTVTGVAPGGPVSVSATYRETPTDGSAPPAGTGGTCPALSNGVIKKSKSNISTN